MDYRERLEKLKEKINRQKLPNTVKNQIFAYRKHIKKLYNIIFISLNVNIFLFMIYNLKC